MGDGSVVDVGFGFELGEHGQHAAARGFTNGGFHQPAAELLQTGHSRPGTKEELLGFLRQNGYKREAVIDLENPKPYELEITTSRDGEHYQITVKRTPDMNDKSTWCKTAAFSDDAGLIYVGAALDCDASAK